MDRAIFAAGCFWGVEYEFSLLDGVISTEVGYIGGHTQNPTYEEVCSNTTGHAEAVKIEFDSSKITYQMLLDIFWKMHNPTTLNRQQFDIGNQYRSAIFYLTDEQREMAEKSKENLEKSGKYEKKIVTEITPASEFFKAEEYHQQYYKKHGQTGCRRF